MVRRFFVVGVLNCILGSLVLPDFYRKMKSGDFLLTLKLVFNHDHPSARSLFSFDKDWSRFSRAEFAPERHSDLKRFFLGNSSELARVKDLAVGQRYRVFRV